MSKKSKDVQNNAIESSTLDNLGIIVEISKIHAVKPEIAWG